MTKVTTKSHAAVRLPRAQRRDQIVDAAAAAFLAGGYEKTSMEDVARAAGVTRLIVYRIFESKEQLYLAVLSTVLDEFARGFEIEPLTPPTPPAVPSEVPRVPVAAVLLDVARRHPDGFRLLWRHTSTEAEFAELYGLFKAGATEYATGVLGSSLGDDTLTAWAAETLVSTIYESICLWLDRGDSNRDEEFLRLLADGLRATVLAWVSASPRA
jgi:AcrR family transcriptional regulator